MTPQKGSGQSRRNPGWVWVVLAVLLAIVAVASLWWWKAVNSTAVTTCDPNKVSLSLGKTERINDTPYIYVVATNNGKAACTLEGQPMVSAVEGADNYVLSVAESDPHYSPSVVTLAPRGQAHAAVGLPSAERFEPGICAEPTALQVYLPMAVASDSAPILIGFPHKTCPGFSVTAFKPGA